MINQEDKIEFFVPLDLVKAKGKNGENKMIVKGIASTIDKDSQGEILDPDGFDLTAINERGYLNWHHQATKNPKAIIGEPTITKIIKGKGMYLEGELYPDSAMAQEVYDLGIVLQKNSKKRRLGFSIEGKALERDPMNPKRITKASITGCAITFAPINKNTLCEVLKGDVEDNILQFDNGLIKDDIQFFKAETGKDFSDVDEEEDEEKTEKALSAGSASGKALTKESLDGDVKNLKKSDLDDKYDAIRKILFVKSDIDITKAELIFTQLKDNKMNKISEDSINKALKLLGVDSIEKGGTPKEFNKKNGSVESFFKKSSCGTHYRKMINKGDKEEFADDKKYMKKGEGDEAEYEEADEKDEENKMSKGDVTSPDLQKGEAEEEIVDLDNIEKALNDLTSLNNQRFSSLGIIMKGMIQERGEMMEIIKGMSEKIETLGSLPSRSRRTVKGSAAVERFAKAEGADGMPEGSKVYSMSNPNHKRELVSHLDSRSFEKGNYNNDFGSATVSLETQGTLSDVMVRRLEKEDKIFITK